MDYNLIDEEIRNQGFTRDNLPLVYTNEDGENVIVGFQKFGDESAYVLTTYQNNGWSRTNIYHEDGTYEELYDR